MSIGHDMHALASELFPIPRSLTGDGVRRTLEILGRDLPGMTVHEVPTGTQCFDWTVPDEWNVREAWIEAPDGTRLADFADCNLHLVGYSEPVEATLTLDELQPHLHSLPEQPDAIPYVTSYYRRTWGFCLRHDVRERLVAGAYRVRIDADLRPGSLTYGELLLPGDSEREILLSTYVCHPSMANNELSGPVVTWALARWLRSLPRRRHAYRVVFVPETLGSIAYISRNLDALRERVEAGFNLTCVGDEREYGYLPSRRGDTVADRAALHALRHVAGEFRRWSFRDRGSDERQYCAPGVDLPLCSMMRSRYTTYPEYHTSLDDLELVTPQGLEGSFELYRRALQCLDANVVLATTVLCEPQLGKRGLYPTTSKHGSVGAEVRRMMDLLAYADGSRDLLSIADEIECPLWVLADTAAPLLEHGLLRCVE